MKAVLSKFIAPLVALTIAATPLIASPALVSAGNKPKKVITQDVRKVNKQIVHIKFAADAGVQLVNGQFTANDAAQAQQLNTILANAKKIGAAKLAQPNGTVVGNALANGLKDYYKVRFAKDVDVASITTQLQQLNIVDEAYAQPLPAPQPTANYASMQTYENGAPTGVTAGYGYFIPGGLGNNVKIVDIEDSWNTSHEDLKGKTTFIPNGTPWDPFNDNNHGTAVLGEMVGVNNGYGVNGIAQSSSVTLINASNNEHGWDLVDALNLAASNSKPGDVILVEQQTYGPSSDPNGFVPVEWVPEVYDAIHVLTYFGRIVVEPAGNGNQNLDDTSLYGTNFPSGKADSGAIIVGAGEACTGSGTLRSRLPYSTYGSRVNVQGPGDCVVSTGYGDLYSAAGVNAYYTQSFSGTSSASPVIAAAAADLSSTYKALNGGKTLNAFQIRTLLMQTGTAQTNGSGLPTGNIGPLPNLANAFPKTDTTAPSVPGNVGGGLWANKQPVIAWNASTDNWHVANYRLYRNGVLYKTLPTSPTYFFDNAVTMGQTYTYRLTAVDSAGNVSAQSTALTVTVK